MNQEPGDRCSAEQFNTGSVVDCREWIYDKSVYTSTFAAEVNMVCGNQWQVPLFQSIFFFGVLVRFSIVLMNDAFGLQLPSAIMCKTSPLKFILVIDGFSQSLAIKIHFDRTFWVKGFTPS